MIRRCFTLFDGIGPQRDRSIKMAGIADWREFLDAPVVPGLPEDLRCSLLCEVRKWSAALTGGDTAFFLRNLPRSEHWMLFEAFGSAVRYVDIETTGLSAARHDVTVVGIYDGRRYRALVKGQGLTAQALERELEGCNLLVSYYGTQFDVPFLRAKFPEVNFERPHFDLCFGGRRVGLTGGMKGVERKLGIRRPASLAEVDGYEAVRLWRAYERGSPAALERLLQYNEADTCNLACMAQAVYPVLCERMEAARSRR